MKRYVQVGCGHRGIEAYAVPLVKEYGAYGALCGVYDVNPKRAALVSEYCGKEIPVYDSFSRMLEEAKPDTVIVTTVDCFHDQYIIAALEAGLRESFLSIAIGAAANLSMAEDRRVDLRAYGHTLFK